MNEYTKSKIEEAERVGRCPWCADGGVENYVYYYMNGYDEEKYPQESFWESQNRWLDEGVITQEKYDKIVEQERNHKVLDELFKVQEALRTVIKSGIFYELNPVLKNADNILEQRIWDRLFPDKKEIEE